MTELGAFMRNEFLCVSVLRVASGPRVKLASCKSALTPPVVYSADRSKAVVPVLVLLFVALWFILRGDSLYVFPCVILFDLCLFGFVGFLFLFESLWVWEGLRFVIVALPGLFSYLFLVVVGLIVEEILNVDIKCVKVTGMENIGQSHRVKVPAETVYLGEALCKV